MPSKKQKTTQRRRYPVNRIKQTCSYDSAEIAKLFGIHRNTVRHWLKDGLLAIDDRRPILVLGTVLKAFVTERQQARRQKCQPGEFFCFRCRAPRKPWGNMADLSIRTEKIAKLTALCRVCETAMYKAIRRADVPKIAKLISLQALAPERLSDCPDTIANSDFEKDRFHVETQPAK
jgi:hypothetical protein